MESYLLIFIIAALVNFATFIWLVITGFKRSVLWGVMIFLFSPLAAIIFAITNWFDAKKPFLAYLLTSILMLVPLYMMSSSFNQQNVQRIEELVASGEISENEAMEYMLHPERLDELEQAKSGGVSDDTSGDMKPDAGMDTTGSQPEEQVTSADKNTDSASAEKDKGKAGEDDQARNKETESEEAVEEEPLPYPTKATIKPDPLEIKKKEAPKDSVKVSVSNIGKFKGRYFIVTAKSGKQHRGILVKTTKSRIVLERKLYGGTFSYQILKNNIKTIKMLKKEYVEEVNPPRYPSP